MAGEGLPILKTEKHFPHLTHPSVCNSDPWLQPHTMNTFLSEFHTGTSFPPSSRNKTFISTHQVTKGYIPVSATFGKLATKTIHT